MLRARRYTKIITDFSPVNSRVSRQHSAKNGRQYQMLLAGRHKKIAIRRRKNGTMNDQKPPSSSSKFFFIPASRTAVSLAHIDRNLVLVLWRVMKACL